MPAQGAFRTPGDTAAAACPVAAQAAVELLSLPLHPALTESDITRVSDAVGAFMKGRV